LAEIKQVFIVNDHLETIIEDLDLDGKTPSNLRKFIVEGAGLHPVTNTPLLKLEYEKNPNHSGVLFLDIDQNDLDRILNMRKELLARGVPINFDEGSTLMRIHTMQLRGDRDDFDPADPMYHRTSDIKT
jgi:hypothetical protein